MVATLGVLTLPSPASRARRSRDSDLPPGHVSPRPWAGCSALLGEGAGAPPHPGAGRAFRRALRRSPSLSLLLRRAPAGGGSQGAGPLAPRRQVDDRQPEFVNLCPVCLSLTRPLGDRLPRSQATGCHVHLLIIAGFYIGSETTCCSVHSVTACEMR